ncbi:MAG: hypothetical protein HQ562_06760 [Candidatus Marinimicrobia bacterium]|nr:hypothetical protein [Candidatus Neomarinimicrobiota bacterium]
MQDSQKDEIRLAKDSLNGRKQQVILIYFGIDRDYALMLNEIGKEINLTRERVR